MGNDFSEEALRMLIFDSKPKNMPVIDFTGINWEEMAKRPRPSKESTVCNLSYGTCFQVAKNNAYH